VVKTGGGHGHDALLSVSARMPRSIFLSSRSRSEDFPTTKTAFYGRLEAENDSTLIQLWVSDGQVRFATFVRGARQPHASCTTTRRQVSSRMQMATSTSRVVPSTIGYRYQGALCNPDRKAIPNRSWSE
jgi:hypothetical protein